MNDVIMKLDTWGLPAWIALMVVSFVLFWPIGLMVLAFLIWSGRMGCGSRRDRGSWQSRVAETWERKSASFSSTGNRAFDEYREETLRRLEEESLEFRSFLERLRHAKDRSEFDAFMRERRESASAPGQGPEENQPPANVSPAQG